MNALSYRRLPGKQRNLVSVTSLYSGPDHLLLVRSHRLSEQYQRFYFKDIKSIVLRRTMPFHPVWTGLFLIAAAIAALATGGWTYPIGIALAGALFLWLRGASCHVTMQTAVTSERLASLHRLKTAQRVLPLIREQIESVQGRMVSAPDDYAAATIDAPPPFPSGRVTRSLEPRKNDHLYCFAFLAAKAVLAGVWLAYPTPGLERAVAISTLIEFLALVTVLIRQNQQQIPRPLRLVTYWAMGRWLATQLVSISVFYKVAVMDRVTTTLNPLSVQRGILAQIGFVTLLATAAIGLWLSLQRDASDE